MNKPSIIKSIFQRKTRLFASFCISLLALPAAPLLAQTPGSLDPSFSDDGVVITPVGTSNEQIYDMAITADNKIVAAGQTLIGSQNDILVIRYNEDGSLDTSFDGDGIVTTPVGTSNDYSEGVAVQPDGKIVVSGYYYEGVNLKAVILRYNTDGSLDTSFDGDGKRIVDFTTSEDMFRDVQIQSDGKIVICGKTWNGRNYDALLARFNPDGSFDTGFNSTGYNIVPVGTEHDYVFQLKIQPDGKIVSAGYLTNDANEILILRVNSNGTLDNTFGGGDGISLSSWPNDKAGSVFALQLQEDGKIVVGGSHEVFPGVFDARMVIARYTSDGSLDQSFGNAGILDIFIATTETGVSESISDIVLQPDGKIVASASSFYGPMLPVFIVLRVTPDGALDNTFAVGAGYVFTDIGNDNQEDDQTSIEIDNNGKIVVGGYTISGGNNNVALARYFSGDDGGAEPCSTAPTGLFADGVTNNRANLHWDAETGVMRYQVQYHVAGTTRWTSVSATSNVKALSRLTSATTYEYRVRSVCSGLAPSPWSSIATFTTL